MEKDESIDLKLSFTIRKRNLFRKRFSTFILHITERDGFVTLINKTKLYIFLPFQKLSVYPTLQVTKEILKFCLSHNSFFFSE